MGWFLRDTSQIPGHLKSTWDPFRHGLGSEFLLPEVITSGLLFAFPTFRTPANSCMCLHSIALFTVMLTHIILLLIKELSVRKSVGGSMCSITPKQLVSENRGRACLRLSYSARLQTTSLGSGCCPPGWVNTEPVAHAFCQVTQTREP